MRRLIFSAAAALALHGLLFIGLGDRWLKTAPGAKRAAQPLELALEVPPPAPEKASDPAPPAPKPPPRRPVAAPPKPPEQVKPRAPSPPHPVAVAKPAPPPQRIESVVPEPTEQPPAKAAPAAVMQSEDVHSAPPASPDPVEPEAQTETRPGSLSSAAADKVFRQSDVGRIEGIRKAVPRYRENPPPLYPGLARRRGCQGTVVIDVLVTPEGRAADLKIEQSSGYAVLDDSAMAAVQEWVFEPATLGGRAIPMRVSVPVMFSLRD
ncbi:putative Protein tonB2 [uncultured Desulfatiglans sp.]|nr:putative Protein tonB2 [uncultured Desulfatiglans sp.]